MQNCDTSGGNLNPGSLEILVDNEQDVIITLAMVKVNKLIIIKYYAGLKHNLKYF